MELFCVVYNLFLTQADYINLKKEIIRAATSMEEVIAKELEVGVEKNVDVILLPVKTVITSGPIVIIISVIEYPYSITEVMAKELANKLSNRIAILFHTRTIVIVEPKKTLLSVFDPTKSKH